jgi:hypothetical protein
MLFYFVLILISVFGVYYGFDLIRTGSFFQKIQGALALLGGVLLILYSFMEVVIRFFFPLIKDWLKV